MKNNQMMIQKNHAIEIYRYFFALFICTLHFKEYFGNPYPFGGAYLSVEFFLILSGFFLMQTIDSKKWSGQPEQLTWKFVLYRFKRLYPQYILSWCILVVYCIFFRKSITVKALFIGYLPEAFMLQMLTDGTRLNSAMWFVSASFLASILIFYIAKRNRICFAYIIAPLTTSVIYSYYYQTLGKLAGIGWNKSLFILDGFWRALAGLCLGCVVYEICQNHMQTDTPRKFLILRSIYEIGTILLLTIMFYHSGCTTMDFPLTIIIAIFVLSVLYREGSYITKWLSQLKINGTYTYAIYCNHWLINYIIRDYFPGRPFYPMLLIYMYNGYFFVLYN